MKTNNSGMECEKTEKINQFWRVSRSYSAEASKIARQLAFGEGAVFWFFFTENQIMANFIFLGLLFLVLYFVLDVLQYIIGAFKNKQLANFYEQNESLLELKNIGRQEGFNAPMYVCYYSKFFMLLIASLILVSLFICYWIG